jgi:D-alanyl-D-alanine carboxypeptidase/D-alanyl-D-alanine-endopeptidase (penicillin-binding protein 4)
MHILNNCAVIFCLCAFASVAKASYASEMPAPVAAALQHAMIPPESAGIYVTEVGGGAPLVSHNATMPLNPASTMKLVTTYAALELLGPAFTWKTRAYITGARRGDDLYGDLIIRGSGDPKLALQQFWLFLRELRAKGLREIHGNLVLDRSAFAVQPFDAAAFDADPYKPYNAGPDALLLNYRTLRFRFFPDELAGKVATAVEPAMDGYVVQAPRLATGPCLDWRSGLQAVIAQDSMQFEGTYPVACGEKDWYLHVYDMDANRYAGSMFRRMWSDLGGALRGDVVDGTVPPEAQQVAELESAALPEIVRDINKFSNNVMARQLLLTIAADIAETPATAEQGSQIIKTWLEGKSVAAPELVIENGAGLSRSERISAGTLGRLLVTAFESPVMPEFIASLPLVGEDGTMRKRLKQFGVAGHAHVKSGSLRDVRAIAGYVLAASGRRYAVVFLINHPNAQRGYGAHDALLRWVHEQG